MYREVFFDIETKKLFDQIEDPQRVEDLQVSIVSVYRRTLDEQLQEVEGEMRSFWESDFPQMWGMFEGADRVIGFNSVKFDAPILGVHHPSKSFLKLPHFDILEKVRLVLGHRVSLNALVKETLQEAKLASGLEAVDWWNKGDVESLRKLRQYCEQDVEVTKKLYDFGLREKRLRFMNKWNERREFEVDFSYPPRVEEPQLGLF